MKSKVVQIYVVRVTHQEANLIILALLIFKKLGATQLADRLLNQFSDQYGKGNK